VLKLIDSVLWNPSQTRLGKQSDVKVQNYLDFLFPHEHRLPQAAARATPLAGTTAQVTSVNPPDADKLDSFYATIASNY
jgi:hypothetical protein